MTPTLAATCLAEVINPGIEWCLAVPGWHVPFNRQALVPLLTIAGQEGGYIHRVQSGNGPAHGLWQFERNGGVKGVLTHRASKEMALAACKAAGVTPIDTVHVWLALQYPANDGLSLALARLLAWTDPHPLPQLGDIEGAWQLYLRTWNPGKPHRPAWTTNYHLALDAVENEGTETEEE